MKGAPYFIIVLFSILTLSCSENNFLTNGESIYNKGKNLNGEKLLDKSNSRIIIVNSCRTCHGKNGDRMTSVSIKFSYLSNPDNFAIPYNDSLIFRFLDQDLRSNGTKANIGVIWKMTDKDKQDLLDYYKTVKRCNSNHNLHGDSSRSSSIGIYENEKTRTVKNDGDNDKNSGSTANDDCTSEPNTNHEDAAMHQKSLYYNVESMEWDRIQCDLAHVD
ncbi:MAG: hypothetical protein ACKVQV_09075, partial [Bacteroidia bacterium]